MKNILKYLLTLCCAHILFIGDCHAQNESDNRPNIIFIMADDLGYETLAVNGGTSYTTPNIDKMTTEGMRFEHCYAQPQCTPSRVQLLTGIYNVRNYKKFGELDTTQTTMAQLFKKAGYTTGVAGKWQLGRNPNNPDQLGFDDYMLWQVTKSRVDSIKWDADKFPGGKHQAGGRDTRYSQPVLDHNGKLTTYKREDYGPKLINDFSLDFIERNSKENKPFFLFYSMILTHCPFSPTPDSFDYMKNDTAVMTYKGNAKYFGDMMSYMDKMVGNINKKLKELGIAENTLVVFTGDNGTDTPIVSEFQGRDVAGAKFLSTDAGTRVPLIAKWPRVIKPATTNNALIDFTDFMPTFLEVANKKTPDMLDIDGISFLPQLKNTSITERKWVYSWFLFPGNKIPKVFARDKRFKLYDSGEFYDVSTDFLEKQPIPKNSLNQETQIVYEELQAVLSKYDKRRLDAIPE